MINITIRIIFSLFLAWLSAISYALTLNLPNNGDDIVGEVQVIKIKSGDTFHKIARRYDVGYEELKAANPGINPQKIKAGKTIIIPTAFILPVYPRYGIVINLPELRLYYYVEDEDKLMTYPIGIGREGWETPLSETYVSDKEEFPTWYVPESIRKYTLETKGKLLPKMIPPGPSNPLGDFAIRLGLRGYLIHSTNNPSSVGKRSSSGCIRMFPEDAEELFNYVQIGTPVYIIHDPYKVGWIHNQLYLEAHKPLASYQWENVEQRVNDMTLSLEPDIKWRKITESVRYPRGVPRAIGHIDR